MSDPPGQGTLQDGKRRRRTRIVAALVGAWVGLSGPVAADPKSEAQALFESGRAEAKRGDCPRAIDYFARARALYPTAGSLYNIADCEERIGRLVSARTHWTEVLRELGPGDSRAADARAHLELLERRIPTVKIVLPPGAPPGTSVQLDGVRVATEALGTEQTTDPGPHTVIVDAPGSESRSTPVVVAEGARGFVIRAEWQKGQSEIASSGSARGAANEPAPIADPSTSGAGSPPRSTLAYVAAAVGIAGFATSAISAIVLLDKKSRIADHCDAAKTCDDAGLAAASGISGWSATGTVGFGLGVSGIAAFFLLPRQAPGSSTGTASSATHPVAVRASIGRAFTGANVEVSW